MSKKRITALIMAAFTCMSLVACGASNAPASDNKAETAAAQETAQEAPADAEQSAPAASAGKIAVIRNMTSSDHTTQFFNGCIDEGEKLGYTVDTFMSNQDDVKMQDLMEQCLQKDYDIWILSHANEGYQYDIVSRAVEKGIKVVGFDCGGEHVPGVTYTSQDDLSLASLSLDALIEKATAMEGVTEPVNFLEINVLGLIVPFDTRHASIEEYEKAGKLKSTIISPNLAADTYSEVYTAISTALAQDTEHNIHGIWGASSGLIDGAVDALNDSGRDDVIITAVDISDTEIKRLVEQPAYVACAAVDPYVIGMVDVRLAVLKVLGEETPETLALEAVSVTGDQLKPEDTMQTLANYFPDFGSTDLYLTDSIKAEYEKYK